MNKLQHNPLYLQLIVIILLGTLILPTKQSNITQSLRPFEAERGLESSEKIACNRNVDFCIVQRKITKPETIYSFSIKPKVNFGLYLTSDNDRELNLKIEVEPFENVSIFLHSYEASISHDERFYRVFYLQQKWAEATVPGPIEDLRIAFLNQFSEIPRNVIVTISRSETPHWVIPVVVSVGGVIVATIFALLYYRRRRRRINRRSARYQTLEMIFQSASLRQARQESNRNRRQQHHALSKSKTKHTLKEVLKICYPEANFEQLESSFPQKTCTICLEDMHETQPCRQFNCQHIFHSQCAKNWLRNQCKSKKKVFCPNCNKRVSLNPKKNVKKKKLVDAPK